MYHPILLWARGLAFTKSRKIIRRYQSIFAVLPQNLIIFSVILATLAAIIASQALISGSFTLVSEAIRLKLLPRLRIFYPGETFGQLYIPAVNLGLWLAASFIVVYFQSSAHMEAAYGLAITVTMLMTTTLLTVYLSHYQKVKKYWLAYFSPFLSLLKACFCSFRCKIYAWRVCRCDYCCHDSICYGNLA